MDFLLFKPNSDSPIYQQIVDFVKKGMISGETMDGDELPSRRKLSALLGINPNTVQKAFSILEEEGLIVTSAGSKSVACVDKGKLDVIKSGFTEKSAADFVSSMKLMGISKEDAIAAICRKWEEAI